MRVDVCHTDDQDTMELLLSTIVSLGGAGDGRDDGGGWLGVGLHRFRFPDGELTVFVDAWGVDAAGPDALVQRVMAAMAGAD